MLRLYFLKSNIQPIIFNSLASPLTFENDEIEETYYNVNFDLKYQNLNALNYSSNKIIFLKENQIDLNSYFLLEEARKTFIENKQLLKGFKLNEFNTSLKDLFSLLEEKTKIKKLLNRHLENKIKNVIITLKKPIEEHTIIPDMEDSPYIKIHFSQTRELILVEEDIENIFVILKNTFKEHSQSLIESNIIKAHFRNCVL